MTAASGSTAVMARRSPAEVAGDTAQEALYRRLDFFPTPPWAARAGADLLARLDPEARTLWEPACGAGHMAAALAERFGVFASDVHDFGYGERVDFLGADADPWGGGVRLGGHQPAVQDRGALRAARA